MTDRDTYNGWTNHATWLVNLHLSNDHDTYLAVCEVVADGYAEAVEDARELWPSALDGTVRDSYVRGVVADRLKDWTEETVEAAVVWSNGSTETGRLLALDLIRSALCDVDWREVADGYLEDVQQAAS